MFNFPIVVLIEESEDLPEVLGLLLALEVDLVEDVVFSPFYLVVVVQIISLQKLSLNFLSVQIFQMLGVGGSVNASLASFDHRHN